MRSYYVLVYKNKANHQCFRNSSSSMTSISRLPKYRVKQSAMIICKHPLGNSLIPVNCISVLCFPATRTRRSGWEKTSQSQPRSTYQTLRCWTGTLTFVLLADLHVLFHPIFLPNLFNRLLHCFVVFSKILHRSLLRLPKKPPWRCLSPLAYH